MSISPIIITLLFHPTNIICVSHLILHLTIPLSIAGLVDVLLAATVFPEDVEEFASKA